LIQAPVQVHASDMHGAMEVRICSLRMFLNASSTSGDRQ
jgi:hypothetical protein